MDSLDLLKVVMVVIVGYLLGSLNTSLIVGKFYGVDVRKHGSGNAGATNTLRTLGKTAALLATLGDMLKGVIACILGYLVIGELGVMSGGIAAIIGHNWPLYFKFKGGKGVLTSFAVALMMDWKISLILFGIFLIIVIITRYVSLGSMITGALFPIAAAIFGKSAAFIVFASILGGLLIFRHHANIKRIINGTESKFGAKKAV